ncbi:hypothetical protein HCN44_006047 [Aphidius gifuensis]|uniref:Uncharacterized protein n=1 Tax=Aphidius gifuensis TaxID=684658 RepID=A0A834Y3Q9_APHGI|nr:hypothetical protein HCN44_006047 [Aphidius gifuensis]
MSEKRLSVEKKVRVDNVINESSSETSSTDLINTLPSECLAKIFMCLDVFDRMEIRKNFPTQVLNTLPEGVDEITLSTFPVCPFDCNLEKFHGLRILNLENYSLNKNTMQEIAKKTTIVKLSLDSCHIENEDAALISDPINLETLHLSGSCVSEECVIRTVKNCKTIRTLKTLKKFHGLRILHLEKCLLKKNTMQEIAQKTTIVKLSLDSCRIENEDAALISNPINLETLHLRGSCVSEECVIRTVKNCKTIKSLMVDCDLSLFAFGQISQLNTLKCLNVHHVDNLSVIRILSSLKNLTELHMNYCKSISNVVLQDIGRLRGLECLVLSHSYGNNNVDDDVIISISNNCNKLKRFELSNCKDATASALRQLAKLKNLEVLSLEMVKNFDDDVFIDIVSECKNLNSLKIDTCFKLTDIGLKNIAKLENLETLHLVMIGNTHISDAILNGVYKLKSLFSVAAVGFTVEGLKMLFKNCSNLQDFASSCGPINDDEVLSCAVEETCRRTNNTLLTINIKDSKILEQSYEKFKHTASLSPLLKFAGQNL